MFNGFVNRRLQRAVHTGLPPNSPTDLTVRNPQFNADGSAEADTRLLPTERRTFGAVTGAQAMRTLQAQIRFQF